MEYGEGRVPPQDLNAEKALLGILIMDGDLLQQISTILSESDFYQKSHQALYRAMNEFRQKQSNTTMDFASLVTFLTNEKKLDECGGAAYLASLSRLDTAALPGNAQLYAEAIKQASLRRQTAAFAQKLRDAVYTEPTPVQSLLGDAQVALGDLETRASSGAGYESMTNVFMRIADILQDPNREHTEIMSGFKDLDAIVEGFHRQDMIVIGARPSVGKSAFMLSMALNMAMAGTKVGFFSLEMGADDIGERLIAGQSGVPMNKIRRGVFSNSQLQMVVDAISGLCEMQMYVQATPNLRLMDLRSYARQMKLKDGVQIIFIDYIGLVSEDDPNSDIERFNWIGKVSRALKQLARELNIPIVVACQLARDAQDQEPKLNQLRDSGSIEQDADVVILLHRPAEKDDKGDDENIESRKVIVAKNRNGAVGDLELSFNKPLVRFFTTEGGRTRSQGANPNA